MDVKVLFFARSRELVGAGDALLQLAASADTATFIEELYRKVRSKLSYFPSNSTQLRLIP